MESRWSLRRIFKSSYNSRHETKVSSWLPPVESWDSGGSSLPYGWEAAVDKEGKTYYINHVNKTSTYEDPRKDSEEDPPQPREVELVRDPQMGFGFVAGSEKPVIVRFVTEGGPNEHKLMPGDQILKINGEDVMKAPREHVIEVVRSCKYSVTLTVCQPQTNNTTRKSALLTAAKKAKLKHNPSRVRFAEGVVINGSPLYSPSPLDSCVPFLPNVLKVFMENGQTKSFKYDSTTTVKDVLNSLQEKLSIKCADHFSLVTEHVKIARRNRLAILDPKDTLAKIAARPGAHHLRCLFRVAFVPKDAYDLLQKDPVAFEYLYVQCCNDVVQERFAPELKYDIALRLAALHIQQHALSNGMQGKITVKAVERESGLDRFVPMSLLETMKIKELRKLLSHFLKQNQSLCAPGQKQLTALQAKLHYLKIISELPSYGAKCFSTNLKDSSPETALLVSPRFGISHITCLRNNINRLEKKTASARKHQLWFYSNPISLAHIEELSDIHVRKEDELSFLVEIFLKDPEKQALNFSMEDRDAEELVLLLRGYYRLFTERDLTVQWEAEESWRTESVPSFHNRHAVQEAPWSYPPRQGSPGIRTLDLAVPPPPYISHEQQERNISRSSSREQFIIPPMSSSFSVDHNMNEMQYMANGSHEDGNPDMRDQDSDEKGLSYTRVDEKHPGIDYQSVISMELLEDSSGDVDVDLFEAKNEEVIRRISEMNKIVVDAESYLFDDPTGSPYHKLHLSTEDLEVVDHPPLKAADSLLLLTQQNQTTLDQAVCQLDESARAVLDDEISPSESDTDSTPNDSPLHRSTPIRNSLNSGTRVGRRDSSFGLHSPDLLPGMNTGSNNIIEILKQLQSEEIQLPFAEGTLYLDPDIIDLTMIPPPITPDMDVRDVPTPLNAPPTPFLDSIALQELKKWVKLPDRFIEGAVDIKRAVASGLQEGLSETRGQELEQVDSARVVADLDHLCDALSEMQAASATNKPNGAPKVTVNNFSDNDSLDSFIASVAVPLPPSEGKPMRQVPSNDDLSAYIIPPPPSSSPSTEAQNEVIARFMAAAEDMRRMFGGENSWKAEETDILCESDVAPTPESSFRELQKFWKSSENPAKQDVCDSAKSTPESHLQETLNILENFTSDFDSEFQSGDSSGYNTLTSSLTSYCETAIGDEISNSIFNGVKDEEVHGYSSFPSSLDSTPVFEHAPTSLSVFNSTSLSTVPATPRTKTTCIDATSPLSITSPSSTTSSDSSVILLDSTILDRSDSTDKLPPRLKKSKLSADSKYGCETGHSGSCDNLPTASGSPSSPNIRPSGISRSISWTSMADVESPVALRKQNASPPLKAASSPQSPHQIHVQKSFSKGPPPSPPASKQPVPSSVTTVFDLNEKHCSSPTLHGDDSPRNVDDLTIPSRLILSPEVKRPLNGMTSCPVSNLCSGGENILSVGNGAGDIHVKCYHMDGDEKDTNTMANGCIYCKVSSDVSTQNSQSKCLISSDLNPKTQKIPYPMLRNLHSKDMGYVSHSVGPFHQAQQDISSMVMHLMKLGHLPLKAECNSSVDDAKFNAAKEALINESRQFVTSSKLFVKSAMESSDKMIENMAVCVALMNRMFTVGELVIMHMCSDEKIVLLIERLKDVAIAYLHTVDAAQKAVGTGISNPQMGVLMHQATTLATALTSLMRTLRTVSTT